MDNIFAVYRPFHCRICSNYIGVLLALHLLTERGRAERYHRGVVSASGGNVTPIYVAPLDQLLHAGEKAKLELLMRQEL